MQRQRLSAMVSGSSVYFARVAFTIAVVLLVVGPASTRVACAEDSDDDGMADVADLCPADARNRCVGPPAVDSVAAIPIRINAGVSNAECSGAKVDCAGDAWGADFGFEPGSMTSSCNLGGGGTGCTISGIEELFGCSSEETVDLFRCERVGGAGATPPSYSFLVPDGRYVVNLYFANTYTGTTAIGSRVFDIAVEGVVAYDDFDQVAAVGGSGRAVVRAVDVTVSDGNGLQIELHPEIESPAIKALEVLQVACAIDPGTLSCVDPSVGFHKGALSGATSLNNPTVLEFGPDGRLYVAQQDGYIRIYSLARSGAATYAVTATETINLIRQIPNHDDHGALASTVTTRLVTGMAVGGTAARPVIYVSSSDPRMGGGSAGTDKGTDTNSGVISRLTWNGSSWQRLDLVRGLPRSKEMHATNGVLLDEAADLLYVAQGGNTNMGAPSLKFVSLPEYALSSAILTVDLDAIGEIPYDLPTLDDEDRPGVADAGDPFGGNGGKNQAILVPNGPVQVYASGFRNPYDLVMTRSGRIYTITNGANGGGGDEPVGEGTAHCTNAVSEPGSTLDNSLLRVSGAGYYGGHPNPTRAWRGNTFNASNPQSPVPADDSIACDFRTPGEDGALWIFPESTNGITEYTTGHFGGRLQRSLLAASFDDRVYRIELSPDGTQATNVSPLFSSVGATPLDVIASRASDPFPGTVWVADYGGDAILVYEPVTTGCSVAGDCDDADPCTTELCSLGVCQAVFNMAACDDGVACTVSDACDEGECRGIDACSEGKRCELVSGTCENRLDPLVDMTMEDFHVPGTQAGDVPLGALKTSDQCATCHGAYDVDNEPHATWRGSLMGLAGRDPLFYAQMATANQDVANVGYFCMRCHVPMSIVTGHALDVEGRTLDATDLDGVTCHLCHSMVDPVYKPGASPVQDVAVLAAHEVIPSSYGNAAFVLDPSGLRRGPYDDANAPHEWVASPFHRSGEMCGTCHDVGNVAVTRQEDGTYRYNTFGEPSPTGDLSAMFPLERTYTEWKLSTFANGGVDMLGRFGGAGASVVETCQDCHMPKAEAAGCNLADPRPDLARHSFAGAAAPILDLIAAHYEDDPDVDLAAIARGRAAAVSMLERAARLEVEQSGWDVDVRVVNESGHKIPTGHIEGRRIWLNVRFFGADEELVGEHGRYDDDQAELDEASTVVFEMHVGLSADAAAATGYPAGPTGHMALADTIEKDNRIPPRGFSNTAFLAAGAPVVGATYADGQHWHDSRFEIPEGAVRAEVRLYYQNTPRHYIEMLRDNNVTDHWGDTLQELWERTGRGAPIVMQTANLNLATSCRGDADCDDGDACNGTEQCERRSGCLAGTVPVCDDGNVCNGTETCDSSIGCQAGAPLVCDDGDLCNGAETCDPVAGCEPGTALECDDGAFCTGVESCVDGECLHPGDPCAAGAECARTCDESTDSCYAPAGAPCADDGNPCTDERCDGLGACLPVANEAGCDDGLFCTTEDLCLGGVCRGAGDPCGTTRPFCDEDRDRCSACASAADCTALDADCVAGVCDGTVGECVAVPVNELAPCDDADSCSFDDHCAAGRCTGTVSCDPECEACDGYGKCVPLCGHPLSDPATPPCASDSLFLLHAAVGDRVCALCVCDVNDSKSVTASDALVVLTSAVGVPMTFTCPVMAARSSTTSTTLD